MQSAARWIMATASPVQEFVGAMPGVTHEFCLDQALDILRNDGHEAESRQFTHFIGYLHEGAAWIDRGWRNIAHYYHPVTELGLWGGPSAAIEIERYFYRAVRLYRKNKMQQAMFCIGAACHLVQDLCEPHHAKGVIFAGHHGFERFAESHREEYAVTSEGIYQTDWSPRDWLRQNARLAYDHFGQASSGNSRDYDRALRVLLPRAQRCSAGFLHSFWLYAHSERPVPIT